MAQERSATPEKQLLRLIENPAEKGTGVQSQAIKHRSLGLLSLGAWFSRFSFFKGKATKWAKGEGLRQSDIKAINKILALCIVAVIAYFITSVSGSVIELQKTAEQDLGALKTTTDAESAVFQEPSLLKAESFYLESVRKRNIFEIGETKVAKKEEAADVRPPSEKMLEITQYLKLVGISWSDDPDAMIEDSRALRTFFVKRGETIGEVKVQAIFKDKVILNYKGEEIELR